MRRIGIVILLLCLSGCGKAALPGEGESFGEELFDEKVFEEENPMIYREPAAETELPQNMGELTEGAETSAQGEEEASSGAQSDGTSGGADQGQQGTAGDTSSGTQSGGTSGGAGQGQQGASAGTALQTAPYGALAVDGTQLVDSSGNPVQLRGVSTHGLAWYPGYVNADCFRELKVILSDGNPNTYIEEAKTFFSEMSQEYAEYTNVLYEICNEPNGGVSWSDVKSYAEQIIAVIRGNDEDGVILVGTPNWSQYVDQAAADPIQGYDNIMYTLHFYAAAHKDSLRTTMINAVEAGLPVFVSEYGICDASGNGGIDTYQADLWVDTMNTYGISYVAWNLSNKSETSAIIKSSCSKLNGFTEENLSDSGKWLYKMLGAAGTLGETANSNDVTANSGTGSGGAGRGRL